MLDRHLKSYVRLAMLGAAVNLLAACEETPPGGASSEPRPSQSVKPTPRPSPSPAASMATTPSATASAANSKMDFAAMTALDDPQIVATLIALNQGEVDQAAIAVKSAKDDKVKKFADHMTMDHSQWKKDVEDVAKKASITQKSGDVTAKLEKESNDLVSKLKGTAPDAFDATYIDSQVTVHQTAIDLIDQRLMKDVKNADLKKAVETAREKIQGHLEDAKTIQAGLAKGASPAASAALSASAAPSSRK
ncbi:MAG: DUF4142 domain-containing protein [Polyangiaceae bacterium]